MIIFCLNNMVVVKYTTARDQGLWYIYCTINYVRVFHPVTKLTVIRKSARRRYDQAEFVSTELSGNRFPGIVNKLAGRGPMLRTAETSPQFRLYGYSHTVWSGPLLCMACTSPPFVLEMFIL